VSNIGFLFGKVGDGQAIILEAIPGAIPPPVPLPFVTQEIFVNKGGSDATGNGTQGAPYLTIAHALSTILDATTAKRYDIRVGPGEYVDPFQMKPWVGVTGNANASGFYGLTEITAAADTCNLDPAAFGGAGFSVFWISNVVFANHQTWSEITAGNPQVQGTFYNVDFNGGLSFIGPGTGGVDNFTLDNCIVYSGAVAQGIQFFFTIGGTQFLGGTVTIEAAPAATALESTTWLAQNTAIGSAFNPTNVRVFWAAPTPVAFQSKIDFTNSQVKGTVTLDGAQAIATFAGLRPQSVVQVNGAPAPTWQAITIELTFTASTANALAALQTAGTIPKAGTLLCRVDGYGAGGGSGGGQGGAGAGPGQGGGGGGAAHLGSTFIDVNLANGIDVNIGNGGTAGAAGAAGGGAGGNGGDGGNTNVVDHVSGAPFVGFAGAQGGNGGGTVAPFTPGGGGVNFAGGTGTRGLATNVGFEGAGGAGGTATNPGFNGNTAFVGLNRPGVVPGGGGGGLSGPGQGGGGGGGGGGPQFANGGNGGNGTAGNGVAGTAPAANSGSGAGGGSGGAVAASTGGPGLVGGSGWLKLTATIQ
jgi:hypothetical protein